MSHSQRAQDRICEESLPTQRVFRAPGRVNLIGEHTDYNEGFVMPANIDLATRVSATPRDDRKLAVRSKTFKESFEFDLDEVDLRPAGKWSDYVIGVSWALEESGLRLRGADIVIDGDVPIGAGLSSSASIEVAAGLALTAIAGARIDLTELALICQKAENEFVGARCGIMDQFVICRGRAGRALFLDCRDLSYRDVPLPSNARLVIANTMVGHAIASGEYNRRRDECEQAAEILVAGLYDATTLRDITRERLEALRGSLAPTLYRRARHIVTENDRVRQAAAALETGDIERVGRLMNESHASLRDDFEVSCSELDAMADAAREVEGVWGARMTGGGFGGCVIALVQSDAVKRFAPFVAARYLEATGIKPWIHVTSVAGGAAEISPREFGDGSPS